MQNQDEVQESMKQLVYKRKLIEIQARYGRIQGAESDKIMSKIQKKKREEKKNKKALIEKMDEKLENKFDQFLVKMEELDNNPALKKREQIMDKE
jgi:hypothetical protein